MSSKTVKFLFIGALALFTLFAALKAGKIVSKKFAKKPLALDSAKFKTALSFVTIEKHGAKPIKLAKENDGWVIREPEIFACDKDTIEGIVDDLANSNIEHKISSRKESFSKFGLTDKKAIKVTADDAQKKHLLQILIGDQITGSADEVYMRYPDKSRSYIIKGIRRFTFDQETKYYKDRLIAKIANNDVSQIIISLPGKQAVKMIKDGEDWKIKDKAVLKDKVLSILSTLEVFEATDFPGSIDLEPGINALGLGDRPETALVSVTAKGAQTILRIGKKKQSLYYVKLDNKPTVWLAAQWKIKPLLIKEKDLLPKD
ncbi:DUF4340 domain-containing protein [Elusimicrobiota bacterium]